MFEKFLINIDDYEIISRSRSSFNINGRILVQNINSEKKYIAKIFLHYLHDELFFFRFYTELYKLIRCQNPTLIHFVGYSLVDFEGSRNPVIILENQNNNTLEKQPLSDFEQLTSTQRQIMLIGIARAMMILHNNRIIYSNIKPSNILIDANFHPIISDFCFSNFFGNDDEKHHPKIFESLVYMAPETLKSDDFSYKSDVFAFSILMYEVVTGNKPYPQIETQNIEKLKNEIINGHRPSFENITISQPIKELICQCWSNNSHDRPSFDTIFLKLANLEGTGNTDYKIDKNVDIEEINKYVKIIYQGGDHFESEDKCIQNVYETVLCSTINQSNEQLKKRISELEKESNLLKSENRSLSNMLDQEKKNNFELKSINDKLNGQIELKESTISLKDSEIIVLKNNNVNLNEDLIKYKRKCKDLQDYINGKVLEFHNNNICVADYFKRKKDAINIDVLNLPGGSVVKNSFNYEPMFLTPVSLDDQLDLNVDKQPKLQTDDDVQNNQLVISENNSFDLTNFDTEYSSEEITKSATQNNECLDNALSETESTYITTIDHFNTLDLESKKSLISSIQNNNSSFLMKIEKFLSFLFDNNFTRSNTYFELLTDNSQEDLNQDIDNFQIRILPQGTESLINDNQYNEQDLNDALSQFNDILFDIKYSPETFKSNLGKVMKIIKPFGEKAKIALAISNGIDKNISFCCENKSISSIYFDETVTIIKESSFKNWKYLKQIYILAACSLEKSSFSGCTSLEKVYLKNLKSIEKSAFQGCTSLKEITIPSSVENIGDNTFQSCTKLTNVILENPCKITSLCNNIFFTCTSLKQITIPLSVTKIGASAFAKCNSLEEIIIPSSVKEIGTRAFCNCTSLKNIIFDPSIKLISIGEGVFSRCSSLFKILIPTTVELIGVKSFGDCSSLNEISIPPSVKSIGNSAFEGCQKLQKVSFNDIKKSSLESIGEYAFSKCPLTFIQCPINAKIESNSFPSTIKISYKKKK